MTEQSIGLNVEQMAHLATRVRLAGESLLQAEQAVSRAGRAAWWEGSTAARFRAAWSGGLSARLRNASSLLHHQSSQIRTQMQQQVHASGADSVGAPVRLSEVTAPTSGGWLRETQRIFGAAPVVVDAYGWFSNVKDIRDNVPLVAFMARYGVGHGETLVDSVNAGLKMSKTALTGLARIPFLSIGVGLVDVGYNAHQSGWTSGGTYSAGTNLVGSTAATTAAGPLGGVVWDLTSRATKWAVEETDRRFDTSGAFVNSVVARTGAVPDYSGGWGLAKYLRDGALNAVSPAAWGIR